METDEAGDGDMRAMLEKTNALLEKSLRLGSPGPSVDSGLAGAAEEDDAVIASVIAAKKTKQREEHGDPTKISLRVEFLKIGDVDTKKQEFTGEVLIEARWDEPELRGIDDERLDELETRYGEIWNPKLVILNMDQAPRTEDITYDIEVTDGMPVVIYRRKLRGSFFERLELRHFPFDVQELSLHILSEHPAKYVHLVLDEDTKSNVHTHTFRDADEWTLFHKVSEKVEKHASDVKQTYEDDRGHFPVCRNNDLDQGSVSMVDINARTQKRVRRNRLMISCFVARNYGYWLFNVFTVLILINCLTFTPFAFLPTQTSARLGVMMSLLLTTVAKKMALGTMLPPISYLTYLDIYMMSVLAFLGLQATQFAVASIWVKKKDMELVGWIDFYSLIGMACILATFNFIYFLYVFCTAYAKRKRLGIHDEKHHHHHHSDKKNEGGEREKLNPQV